MFETPYEFETREFKKALSTTIGGNDDIIIEIFSSRPKSYLNIQNKLSKNYSKFLLTLMEKDHP